jgi:hypothetical protein
MAEVADQTPAGTFTETDLVAAVRQVLQRSEEPLTLSKIRAALPTNLRGVSLEALEATLQRQTAANVLHQYPKYRSPQNRYWDRPMGVHLAHLLRTTLQEKPLSLSELRRKLPDYARHQAERVLEEEVNQGRLYSHPALSSRSGPRFGAGRPDPKDYLRAELATVFRRLEQLGFNQTDLREGAIELLHDEEWAPTQETAGQAATPPEARQTRSGAPQSTADQDEASARAQTPAQPAGEGQGTQTGSTEAASREPAFGEGSPS